MVLGDNGDEAFERSLEPFLPVAMKSNPQFHHYPKYQHNHTTIIKSNPERQYVVFQYYWEFSIPVSPPALLPLI